MFNYFNNIINRGMSSTQKGLKVSETEVKRKLKQSEIDFMKVIEKQNLIRVAKLKALKRRNNLTGLIIGGTVISIYLYSMLAIKQEKFLDDFNEPQKVAVE